MEQAEDQPTRAQLKEMKESFKKTREEGVFTWGKRPFRDVAYPSLCAFFHVHVMLLHGFDTLFCTNLVAVAGIAAAAYQLILCKGDFTHALLIILRIHRLMETAH